MSRVHRVYRSFDTILVYYFPKQPEFKEMRGVCPKHGAQLKEAAFWLIPFDSDMRRSCQIAVMAT